MEVDLDGRPCARDDTNLFNKHVGSDTSANAAGTAAESRTTCTDARQSG
jgi:hypothetical protein